MLLYSAAAIPASHAPMLTCFSRSALFQHLHQLLQLGHSIANVNPQNLEVEHLMACSFTLLASVALPLRW